MRDVHVQEIAAVPAGVALIVMSLEGQLPGSRALPRAAREAHAVRVPVAPQHPSLGDYGALDTDQLSRLDELSPDDVDRLRRAGMGTHGSRGNHRHAYGRYSSTQ